MSVARVFRSAAAQQCARAMSTAPASAAHIDWAAVRAKMTTDATRSDADRARDSFAKRLSAADSVRPPADIDWAAYKKALPELNIDALKADYEKAVSSMPSVSYDESADRQAHEKKEASWNSFAAYCASRVKELQQLQTEQTAHKLHPWYRRRQLYARFPGMYENLHNKVRGTWDVNVWGTYLAYRAKATALPWDPAVGEVDAARRKEIMQTIAAKAGVAPETLFGAAAK